MKEVIEVSSTLVANHKWSEDLTCLHRGGRAGGVAVGI